MAYTMRLTPHHWLNLILILAELTFGNAGVIRAVQTKQLSVYFGHTPGNSGANLLDLCYDPSVDIISIGFIRSFDGSLGKPTLDLVKSCKTPANPATSNAVMITCPQLAQNVSICQSLGKKVLLSIGGSVSDTSFSNATEAVQAATTLWTMFGPDTSQASWRPLGSVSVDGYDFDQESGDITFYDTFASTFRNLSRISGNSTLLSATYSCAYPTADTTIQSILSLVDYTWVRFYNAKSCSLGYTGFLPNLKKWLQAADSISKSGAVQASKIYVGALAFNSSSGVGFVAADNFPQYVKQALAVGSSSFGGVMLWDGTEGQITTNSSGATYNQVAKAALTSTQ